MAARLSESPHSSGFSFSNDAFIRDYCCHTDKVKRLSERRRPAASQVVEQDVVCIGEVGKPRRVQMNMDSFVIRKSTASNPTPPKPKQAELPPSDGFVMASGSTEIVREVRRVVPAFRNPNPEPVKAYDSDRRSPHFERRQRVNEDTADSQAALDNNILATIVDTARVQLSDIVGNEEAKRALEESVILPTLNPSLFTGLREPVKGILLFGPPGNGKTMLAKAVASESKCTFFNISAANIMSKWVGEGERLMQTLFTIARNKQPSIIFIDELDSLLCQRSEAEDGATRRVKTEFLLQFDGCTSTSSDRVLVLGATNRPQDLDDGVLRRFPRRIYIGLPNTAARATLIQDIFDKTNTFYRLDQDEIEEVSLMCDGYSFSDLTALCKEAAMAPLRSLSREQLQNLSATQLSPVQFQDLKNAAAVIRPSANNDNTNKLREFAVKYGQT